MHKEKTATLLNAMHSHINGLLTPLEMAKDQQDLNKFIHFDFPRSVRYIGETIESLHRQLDEAGSHRQPFSRLFRPCHEIELALAKAQSGATRLQLAAARKEPFPAQARAAQAICFELEQVKEQLRELKRLLVKQG